MKFTPRLLKENVNISPTSPLRELFVLLSQIVGALVLIYIILGLALDILVAKMPVRLEQAVGNFFSKTYNLKESSTLTEQGVQRLLDDLVQYMPEENLRFRVRIQDSSEVNAFALPGGQILIFSQLLKEVESENELTMILAHELGHFAHRDHLRGLGRGLVLAFISSILFGADSAAANFSQRILLTTDLKFSRQQEIAADTFGLELLSKKYGHVAGADDFFARTKEKKDWPRYAKFLSTHPHPLERIRLLQEQIHKKKYTIQEKTPLSLSLQETE